MMKYSVLNILSDNYIFMT